jgi:hypothetical protein
MNRINAFLISATILVCSDIALADFKKNQVAKVAGVTCGFAKSWFPISKSGGKYIKIKSPTSAQKNACKTLVAPTKISLSKLPNIAKLASSRASAANSQKIQSVSGTPPTLGEIVRNGPTNTFWRPGVVSSIATGSPTAEQCNEFFTGSSDGQSGGFLSCYMNQNAGYALSEVVRSGTTMCYLKNMPTEAVFRDGGFTITRGTLPTSSVTSLFNTPSGSAPRIIKIALSAGGEDGGASNGIIKVFAENQVASSGDLYKYEMIFCEGDAREPQEIEKTRITSSGEFISSSFNTSEGGSGNFAGTVRAFLRAEGSGLVFDTSRSRTATSSSTRNEGGSPSSRKSEIIITSSNEIINKEYGIHSDGANKAYSISRFSGTGMSSLRFFEGAIKQSFSFGEFNGATEFRDNVYVAAPGNSYVTSLSAVDITADSFYSSIPTIPEGTTSISCNTRADIEIAVDMSSEAMGSVAEACEGERIDGIDFCRNNQLSDAQTRYGSVCTRP